MFTGQIFVAIGSFPACLCHAGWPNKVSVDLVVAINFSGDLPTCGFLIIDWMARNYSALYGRS